MELIYIGERFYSKSGSVMSSIYDINGNRLDWSNVRIALRNGQSVHIRPATEKEIEKYCEYFKSLMGKAINKI